MAPKHIRLGNRSSITMNYSLILFVKALNLVKHNGIVVVILSVCLSACSTTAIQKPISPEIPAHWQYQSTNAVITDGTSWWKNVGDSQLTALINEALVRNRDAVRDSIQLQQSSVLLQLDRQSLWPQAQVSVGAGAGTLNLSPNPVGGSTSSSVSYDADLWGRKDSLLALDEKVLAMRKADLELTRWLLSTRVAEVYWTLAAIEAKAQLMRGMTQDAEATLEAVQLRYEAGKAIKSDIEKAKTALMNVTDSEHALDTQRILERYLLATLLDILPETFDAPHTRLPAEDPPEFSSGPPASVLDRRPDVHSARLALDSALLQQQIVQSNPYPTLQLSASLTTGGDQLRQLLSNPIASLAVGLGLPYLNWQRTKSERDLAGLQVEAATNAFRDTLYKAISEVEQRFVERRQINVDLSAARQQLFDAEQTLQVMLLRHEIGAVPLQSVRDARQVMRTSELALIDLRLKSWLNLVATHMALGGPVDSE